MIQQVLDVAQPDYTFYSYGVQLCKVIHWKRQRNLVYAGNRKSMAKHEHKLDSSYSRAKRMILGYALCNPWEWFFTGTLSPQKFDRSDIESFHKRLTQWFRDMRKKEGYQNLAFLIIPEKHDDGYWHCHGLIHGLPPDALSAFPASAPVKLQKKEYRNWEAYAEKFGFCSLGAIKSDRATAFYIMKYVGKQWNDIDTGMSLYYVSRGLNQPQKIGEKYGSDSRLSSVCTSHYQYCNTGFLALDGVQTAFQALIELGDYGVDHAVSDWLELPKSIEEDIEDYRDTSWQMMLEGFQ